MQKLTFDDPETKSADIVGDNIAQLRAIFPEAFVEGKIDFEVLKQLLGGQVDEREEKYGLNWHGKRQARQLALTPSTGTLRPCPEESVDWDTTQNLMIEGDNLEVLKLLQKSYAGKVKLIYIDPPYNTGHDFVYPDDYKNSIKNYQTITGQVDGEGRTLTSNPETSGRFHTVWLNMIYPRLKLARNLLKDDGVLLVSIDDHEIENVLAILAEVFGEENFVANLIWEKGRKNDAKLFSNGHDYIIVYAKSKSYLTDKKTTWRESKLGAAEIQEEYLRLRSIHGKNDEQVERGLRDFYALLPKGHPSRKLSRYSQVDQRGVWRDDNMSWPGGGGPNYDVPHPITLLPCKVPEGGWRYSTPKKMQEMIEAGRVMFREDHTQPPIRKTYLVRVDDDEDAVEDVEQEDAGIQVAGTYFYRSALQASNLMLDLFKAKVFDNPKDHEVIGRWISYICGGDKAAIVVDFFAGSGTTGHAVMAQNASDDGHRRFVLVQLPLPLDPENKEQRTAATFCEQIESKCNLAELTKERLRRVGKNIQLEKGMFVGDVGFRVFKLDSSNIEEWEPDRDDLPTTLDESVEHLKTDRAERDILFELLLKLGLDLCIPIETKEISGKSVHSVGGGVLLTCLARKIKTIEVEVLAKGIVDWHRELAPAGDSTCVFRDSAFEDDVAKSNLAAILEQHGLFKVRSL